MAEERGLARTTAMLGDGEVFIKRTDSGLVKAVWKKVRLYENRGHLSEVGEGRNKQIAVSALGYNEMNKIASISVITPSTLRIPPSDQYPDGREVPNPFPIIDRVSGSIEKVWVSKLAVGLSPIGNVVVTSTTLLYDLNMYFAQDLAKKVQYNAGMGKYCLRSSLTEDEVRSGVFVPVQGELGVYARHDHQETIKAFNTFIQNKLFAERKAQTIAERNVLKKQPALSVTRVEAQGPEGGRWADVLVIGWSHDFTKEELLKIAQMAQRGENVDLGGKRVEIVEETVVAGDDEVAATGVDDDEGGGSAGTAPAAAAAPAAAPPSPPAEPAAAGAARQASLFGGEGRRTAPREGEL